MTPATSVSSVRRKFAVAMSALNAVDAEEKRKPELPATRIPYGRCYTLNSQGIPIASRHGVFYPNPVGCTGTRIERHDYRRAA